MRVSDIFELELKKPEEPQVVEDEPTPVSNPSDRVTMDVPLLLRIMEYSKEDAQSDMDLHHVAEKLVSMSSGGKTLTMNDYNNIINSLEERFQLPKRLGSKRDRFRSLKKEETGDSSAEKLVKDIEYQHDDDNEEVEEGYGRYWCSTDKRWKERKGPKQSRS
jgi:hypothetical protein